MKRLIVISLLYIFSPTCSAAERDWLGIPVTNHALGIASGLLILVDWGLTLDIENHPDLQEDNRNLGKHPSRGKINRFFILKTLANIGVNTWRPLRKCKNILNAANIGITGIATKDNLELGLSIGF